MPDMRVLGGILLMSVSVGDHAFALDGRQQQLLREEANRIQMTNGAVRRANDVLTLSAANGTVVVRRDKKQCGENGEPFRYEHCISYVFVDHFAKQHAFLVLTAVYEGYSYEWIDTLTGEATLIEGEPHFSPSSDRFVVVRASEDDDFNGIQIWSRRTGRLKLEWKHQPTEYAFYEFRGWDGEDAISLAVTTYVDHKLTDNVPARLVKSDIWRLQGPPEASR